MPTLSLDLFKTLVLVDPRNDRCAMILIVVAHFVEVSASYTVGLPVTPFAQQLKSDGGTTRGGYCWDILGRRCLVLYRVLQKI